MAEVLSKLRPDRDLQCYFFRPTAIAALSDCRADRLTVSGTWREQFDWAVIEWNRDNVYEHPQFRNLPDGDLSGLTLSYVEQREGCIRVDSDLYPTVDWPFLRIWTEAGGVEEFYRVPLRDYAAPVDGSYAPATIRFKLLERPSTGQYAGLSWLSEHHTYQALEGDTAESIVEQIAASINALSPIMSASADGDAIELRYLGVEKPLDGSGTGANGNRLGAYSYVTGGVGNWDQVSQLFSGGTSPITWRVTLPFGNLIDEYGRQVPTGHVRKLRWTYAADLQYGGFQRTEFMVRCTEWSVTGTGRLFEVAGGGSYRTESYSGDVALSGEWTTAKGNFSGGSILITSQPQAMVTATYRCASEHRLYLGTRSAPNSPPIRVSVDQGATQNLILRLAGEDVLRRVLIATLPAGEHVLSITHAGTAEQTFYFDFAEAAVPTTILPSLAGNRQRTLATDWDTDHSLVLAPERTAWMIYSTGHWGHVNHYVGALWFYELRSDQATYAFAEIDFQGSVSPNCVTELHVNQIGLPVSAETVLSHLHRVGDSPSSIANAFALDINQGYTALRAEVDGPKLRVIARRIGVEGNSLTITCATNDPQLTPVANHSTFTGGSDGRWLTDVLAQPRLNRALRDWSVAFFRAVAALDLQATAAFSMELQHGDPVESAGLAQRYPSGNPVILNTPAIQTNFSQVSVSFWSEVYREMAELMRQAGMRPSLQFGEVQWWYFPYDGSGLPFYDAEARSQFQAQTGRDLPVLLTPNEDPEQYPVEVAFLRDCVGQFTAQIMTHVRASYPECEFEVLYPPDVNDAAFMRVVNLPTVHWSAQNLDRLKTENFLYTYSRDMRAAERSIRLPQSLGFPPARSAHLVGISDSDTPWRTEVELAESHGMHSVVLFALDQYCLIGYPAPTSRQLRRSAYQG